MSSMMAATFSAMSAWELLLLEAEGEVLFDVILGNSA